MSVRANTTATIAHNDGHGLTSYKMPSQLAVTLWDLLFAPHVVDEMNKVQTEFMAVSSRIHSLDTKLIEHSKQFAVLWGLYQRDNQNYPRTEIALITQPDGPKYTRSLFRLSPELLNTVTSELAKVELSLALDCIADIEIQIKNIRMIIEKTKKGSSLGKPGSISTTSIACDGANP